MTPQEKQIANRLQAITERLDRIIGTDAAALTQAQRTKAVTICMRFMVTATNKLQELHEGATFSDVTDAETFLAHFEQECNDLEQTLQVLN